MIYLESSPKIMCDTKKMRGSWKYLDNEKGFLDETKSIKSYHLVKK